MTRILVAGATGTQGGALIQRLLALRDAESLTIYALTRNPSSPAAKSLAEKGVNIVKGDLNDPSSLTNALKNMERAFLVTDVYAGPEKETVNGKNFVTAAKAAGLEHVVFTSVASANDSGVPHFYSKFLIEEELKSSGLGWTVLRPVAFMENFPIKGGFMRFMALGIFKVGLQGKPLQYIAVKDIAYVAAEALLKPKNYQGKIIGLAADELTVSQVCAAYGKVQYGARWNAWAAWLPYLITWILPADFSRMFQFFREKGYTVDIPALRKEYPNLLTFESHLQEKNAAT